MNKYTVFMVVLILAIPFTFDNQTAENLESAEVYETIEIESLITYWKMTSEIQVSDFYAIKEMPNKNEILICQTGDANYDPQNYIYSLNTNQKLLDVEIGCDSDTFVSPNFILDLQEADDSGNYGYYDVYETNNYQKVRTITFFGSQNLKADSIQVSEDGEHIFAYEDSIFELVKYNTSSWSVENSKNIRFEVDEFSISNELIVTMYKKFPSGNYYDSCGYRTINTSTLSEVAYIPLDYTESTFFGSSCTIPINSVYLIGDYFIERDGYTFSLRNATTKSYVSRNVQLENSEGYMGFYSYDIDVDGLTFIFNMDADENRSEHLMIWNDVVPLILSSDNSVISQPASSNIERIEYEVYGSKPSCIGSIFGSTNSCLNMFDEDTFFVYGWSSISVFEKKVGYDGDGDLVVNEEDNCPSTSNPDQRDYDSDGYGDLCDSDDDNDGLTNDLDNCSQGILDWNSNIYLDYDRDGCLDALEDNDDDNDGVLDNDDGCPYDSNYSVEPQQGCGNVPVPPKPDELGPQDDLPSDLENDIDTATDKASGALSNIMAYSSVIINLLLVLYIIRVKLVNKVPSKSYNDISKLNKLEYQDEVNDSSNHDLQFKIERNITELNEIDPNVPGAVIEENNKKSISGEELAKFPGWDEQVVLKYLENGWTIDRLEEYYQEQISVYSDQETQ
jgi:hypothetical protein